jgi:glutaredoxin
VIGARRPALLGHVLVGARFLLWAAVAAAGISVSSAGCKARAGDELPQEGEQEKTKSLPPLSLTDDTPDLLLTWIDSRGDAKVAKNPAEVPAEGREQVRVVVTTREEGFRNLFYVANLNAKNPDGTYVVSTMPRVEWDALIAKRREALLAPSAPNGADEPPAPGGRPPSQSTTSFTVIVYGAAWCGACHEAVAFLKQRKIPVVEKDIERDPVAQSEMQAKLARAGAHGGSIPVIDVKGKILVGFEPHALDAAVRGAGVVTL